MDRVAEDDLVSIRNEEEKKSVTVVSRGLKTNDELILAERREFGNEQTEAIIVIRELKWRYDHLTVRSQGGSEVIEFGDVDANVDHGILFWVKFSIL